MKEYQHKIGTHFLPLKSFSLPDKQAASPVAPAPSTTAFSISTNLNIARAISSSLQGHEPVKYDYSTLILRYFDSGIQTLA